MKFNILVVDPPYDFGDKLKQSKTKRGASSQYKVMKDDSILNMPVNKIIANDALLALWVPSSRLQFGMDCMKEWGFVQKQTWVWVKTKKDPLKDLKRAMKKDIKIGATLKAPVRVETFDINSILSFYMGRYFRQSHEIVLIGAKGKILKRLKDKSQRSVFLGTIGQHSEKPEALQDRLEIMFPGHIRNKKVELFARRDRENWVCAGWECPSTWHEDIYDSIERIAQE